jgi:hypothetical protein
MTTVFSDTSKFSNLTVQKIVDLGIAERVDPGTTTKYELKGVIIHVAETQSW